MKSLNRLFLALVAVFLSTTFAVPDAEAKRLGGGQSFGMQRNATPPARTPNQAQQRPAQQQNAQPAAAQGNRSWMGPVAGLAAGLGLAALASHLGFGEELASMLLIALLIGGAFLVFRMISRRGQPAPAGAAAGQGGNLQFRDVSIQKSSSAAQSEPALGIRSPSSMAGLESQIQNPAQAAGGLESNPLYQQLDVENFVRQAKRNFIRLQAANDAGDLEDLRSFTTPEVFAELRLQLSERGEVSQRTDVVELQAELVDIAEDKGRYVASVHFNGLIREDANSAPVEFAEIWHLTKPLDEGGWLVAGIQQLT